MAQIGYNEQIFWQQAQTIKVMRERLEHAKEALVETGYFTPGQVSDDIAPRIVELFANRFEEPAEIDAAKALRIAAGHLRGTSMLMDDDEWRQKAQRWLDREADRIEDEQIVRRRDIKIGERIAKSSLGIVLQNQGHAAALGKAAREALEAIK